MTLPTLTSDLPGIGGVLRETPDDFVVEELPRYEPSGEGEHLFVQIEKRGMTTFAAIDRIARQLNLSPRDVGYAGMKDAQAVTRQWISLPRAATAEAAMAVQLPGLRVLRAARHGNKLRVGHLRGNRFELAIRGTAPDAAARAGPILARLRERGMPNYFGEQRFGLRGDNARLGAALLRGDEDSLLRMLLGAPREAVDPPAIFEARRRFDAGELAAAYDAWPATNAIERPVLRRLIDSGSSREAVRRVERKITKLWINSLQSTLFNETVANRIDALNLVREGDLAYLHDRGACFLVTDEAAEQPRADRFEISATGPMFGSRMSMPAGEPLALERGVLARHGLDVHAFDELRDAPGERRPIRVPIADARVEEAADERGAFVRLSFTLPPGGYATIVAREVMKLDAVTASSREAL